MMRNSVRSCMHTRLLSHEHLQGCETVLAEAFDLLTHCFESGGKLLICGNGGSASDAEHMVGELMKGFRLKRPLRESQWKRLGRRLPPLLGPKGFGRLQSALPALSLVSQTSLISAIMNDISAEAVYAQQVLGYGAEGDVLIGISTSGGAENVCCAMELGQAMGLRTIALTGAAQGRIRLFSDVVIASPSIITDEIQEDHVRLYHTLCMMLEEEFFGHEMETEG
ncbi:D-sedoheptulose-7-phosphate isomerase [Paenibacillus lutrae]|nr:SIS domain-containing protein [Paenibacillus lutrae]